MSKLEELLNKTQTNENELNRIDTGKTGSLDPNSPIEWKPKAGEQSLRILPALDGVPIKEVHVHWKVGKRPFLCPKKNFGEPCAVCEFGWGLWNEAKDDKKLKDKAKVFLPDQRYASLVLVRDLEEHDIENNEFPVARIWDFNFSTWKDIRNLRNNEDYGSIEHIITGHDLKVTWDPEAAKTRLQATTILCRPKETLALNFKDNGSIYSKLLFSEEEMAEMIEKILENAPTLYGRYTRVTSDEVVEILQAYEEAPSENSPEITKYGGGEQKKDEVTTEKNDASAKINKYFKDADV